MLKVIRLCHSISPVVIPISIINAMLSSASTFFNIVMSALIIDSLFKLSYAELLALAGIVVAANVILSLVAGAFDRYRMIKVYTFSRHFRMIFMKKIVEMDYEHVENPKTHELRAKVEAGENSYGGWWQLINLINIIITSTVGLIYSASITFGLFYSSGAGILESPFLSVIFALAICASTILTFPIDKVFFKKIYAVVDEMARSNRVFSHLSGVISSYANGKDIRIYNSADMISNAAKTDFGGEQGYFNKFKRLSALDGALKATKAGLTSVTGGLIYLFVAIKAVSGALSVGGIVRYTGGITQFINNLSSLINSLNTFSITSNRMRHTFDFLNIPDIKYKGTLPVEKRRDYEYMIEFKDVSFKYPGTEVYALKKLNLKLNIGQRMAVVGMNGSGKTTMIKLLCRLYDPTEGEITLNGIDIRKYDYAEYMSIFSVVFQDFKLFSFSLGQNVAVGINVDKERAADSLNKAGMSKRLSTMPKGLDTPLYKDFDEDGVEISGGEAQKIALARALYKNAPFIVLDEPTAALDPIAEFEIYSKFNEIVGDKTAIYISHRLSSCRFCDDIAVFHEGQLIQRGSHDKLIADDRGKYYELWNAQSQYYNEKPE